MSIYLLQHQSFLEWLFSWVFNKIYSLTWCLFKHKLLNRIPAFCRRQAPHCKHDLVSETTAVFLLLCRCLRLTTNFAVSFLGDEGQFTRTQPCSRVTSYLQTYTFRSEYWVSHNFWAPFYHEEEDRLSYKVSWQLGDFYTLGCVLQIDVVDVLWHHLHFLDVSLFQVLKIVLCIIYELITQWVTFLCALIPVLQWVWWSSITNLLSN